MPSATFFRLPSEKRERLLRSARQEFIRVPFAEASINRIVRDAEIPRGSFYMYFDGKEDLFTYLISEYRRQMLHWLEDALEQRRGDIFAAVPDLFDTLHSRRAELGSLVSLLSRNRELRQGGILYFPPQSAAMEALLARVDCGRFRPGADPQDVFTILMRISAPCLAAAILEQDCGPVRNRLCAQLDILRQGAQAPASKRQKEN